MYRHQQSHSSALCYTQETNKSEGGRWWGRVSPTRPTVSCHTLHTGDKPEVGGREGGMMGEGCLLQGLQSVSTRYTQETNRTSEGGRWSLQGLQSVTTRYTPAHSKYRLASPTVPHVPKTPPPHTHTHKTKKKKLSLFKFKTLPPPSLSLQIQNKQQQNQCTSAGVENKANNK